MEITKWSERPTKHEYWQNHLLACERSGLSQQEYCRRHSLSLSSFGYWKRKFYQTKDAKPRFYPLTIPAVLPADDERPNDGLSLYLQEDRFRVEVYGDFSPTLLKKLIVTLEQV